MARRKKTWIEKRDGAPAPHVDQISKPFAGMPAGAKVLISSPLEIEAYIRAIPKGRTRTIPDMRADLAKAHKARATCPLTASIFTRIVAEAALEEMAAGKKRIAPFWRVIDAKSPIAGKLSCGPDYIAHARALEGIENSSRAAPAPSAKASRAKLQRA